MIVKQVLLHCQVMGRTDGQSPARGLVSAWGVSDACGGEGRHGGPYEDGPWDHTEGNTKHGGLPCRRPHGNSLPHRNAHMNVSTLRKESRKGSF